MNRLRTSLVLAALLSSTLAIAAPARDGFAPDLNALAAIPRFAGTDHAALRAAQQAAANAASKHQPLQFAVGAEMPLELADGSWSAAADDTAVWRLRVASSGARLIAVSFAQLQLPASARLYLYDDAGTTVQGPYTASDAGADGSLVSAVVPGAEAVLELRVAAAERDQVRLKLARIYHGFRALSGGAAVAENSPLTGNSAASCEVNVACPAGDGWRDPIRSEALVQIGNGAGLYLCSGQLVNNVRNDNTPYFLTAHHCKIGSSLTTPASSVVLYWNYQASSCSGSSGSLDQTQSGSTLVATDAGSDFALIKLKQTPPSNYAVYYAGWDVSTGDIPTSGVAIHQPVADIKKISSFISPASRQAINLNTGGLLDQAVQAWQVSWNAGITEEGSSGSGLWNQDQRIVGVLSGGNTACASGTASSGQDFFGRLDVAWTANNSSSGQLKAWLDPDNTGAVCLNGRNPGDGAAATGCSAASNNGNGNGKSGGGGAWPPSVGLLLASLIGLRARRHARSARRASIAR